MKMKKGFTLVEVTVALAVFTILMSAVAGIFSSAFSGYRFARGTQKDLEAAQFAINTLAKELRTSTIVASSASHVKFFDYSRGKCVRYEFVGSGLYTRQMTSPDVTTCAATGIPSASTMVVTTGTVSGSFSVVMSTQSPKGIGKVTVSMDICDHDCGNPTAHHARIQSTSSLRDYEYVGL
ncbi:MAG: type II secretion system protein [Candidatus Moranbacteria bacterium]|nr:type II secretion system protein [Candidatus Moranbacteria bacterium]